MADMTNHQPIIETDEHMAQGTDWLAAVEPRFGHVLEVAGPPPLRRRPDGFQAIASAIVSQQVSVASANAIRARLDAAGLMEPAAIRASADETLRAAGLSRQKAQYFRALANAGIDFEALRHTPDDQVIAQLTAVKGIGAWTAQIYVMFSLGRADVFPTADLALQESARILFDMPKRPTPKALSTLAKAWSPWRSVAAVTLWHYYHHIKKREGI